MTILEKTHKATKRIALELEKSNKKTMPIRLQIATQVFNGLDNVMWTWHMQDSRGKGNSVQYVIEECYKVADELIKQSKL